MTPEVLAAVRTRTLGVGLHLHGDTVALRTVNDSLSYAELDDRVDAFAERLGTTRRLVQLAADNTVDSIVAYLAALRGRHPVILGPAGDGRALDALTAFYDPDMVVVDGDVVSRREGTAHDLHPELAVLLSTSGSTGTPKLVRLSHDNLTSNAAAIAEILSIVPDDRAIATLPMQYCYGLSVINSYLLAGAGIVLTDLSVVDRCFWSLARDARVTSFAGVPHTFELLDRVGFTGNELPTLRYVTQAGGRMPPERVCHYAELGARNGWDLVVMYGQTEATARMAYLPPALARTHPRAIGVAVPGGELSISSAGADGVGELIYRGPNVMLGYADAPEDLARGRTVDELRTGDLASRGDDGLFEIVGRRSRFVKPFGVRVDLDDLERVLASHDITALCTGDDDRLVVAVTSAAAAAASVIDEHLRLPRSHVSVVTLDELPLFPSGKPDYPALLTLGVFPGTESRKHAQSQLETSESGVRAAFADVLGVQPTGDDSFVGLGGDSLSYVEMSVRLEELLGALPRDWHTMPIHALAPAAPARSRWWAPVETTVVLRAAAIVLIVGSHTRWWHQPGGAHALLAVAGFNFARFQLRSPRKVSSIARIAAPSILWIGAVAAISTEFGWAHALLVNDLFGARHSRWAYWFVEALVQILIPLTVLFAVPAAARFERRRPFLVASAAVAAGLAVRFGLIEPTTDHWVWWPHEVFWLFALGWAAARAATPWHRALVTAAAAVCVPGVFANTHRELIVIAGVAAVAWLPTIPVPRWSVRAIVPLAGASLHIYLVNFQVHPPLGRAFGPPVATIGSLLAGIVFWKLSSTKTPIRTRLSTTKNYPRGRRRSAGPSGRGGDGLALRHRPV